MAQDVSYGDETPRTILQKMLSTRSGIAAAADDVEISQTYTEIGRGTCGAVFAESGTAFVLKKALYNNKQLYNDYAMHMSILEGFDTAFKQYQLAPVNVPRVERYVSSRHEADQEWWATNALRFPKSKCPMDVLITHRVMPLPRTVREALIEMYCPPHMQEAHTAHSGNEPCLVRIYLGKRARISTSRLSLFTLRNFQLHLDQLEDLQLDIKEFATAMADTISLLHWHVHVDGNDVEFVLGRAPTQCQFKLPSAAKLRAVDDYVESEQLRGGLTCHQRATHVWMIDFDKCNGIEMDEDGVDLAVDAFIRNDPYFPRPNVDPDLWQFFVNRYLETSRRILIGSAHAGLPLQFIQKLVAKLDAWAAVRHGAEHRLGSDDNSEYYERE